MAKEDKPDPYSPLFTLASFSAELIKDVACETVSTPTQGMSPKRKIPSVDLEIPSMELSPPPKHKHPTEPFTPNQLAVCQLTQELAQSVIRNE